MNQINVHPSHEPDIVDRGGDRTAAAGLNLITVLIVLAVVAVVLWYLFTGPLHIGSAGGSTTINVNPAPTVNVNPPSQPNAPAPNNPAPSNPGSNSGGNPPANNPPNNNPPPSNP